MIEHFHNILKEISQMHTKGVNQLNTTNKKLVDEGYCTQLEFNKFMEMQKTASKMIMDNRLEEAQGILNKSKNDFEQILKRNGL